MRLKNSLETIICFYGWEERINQVKRKMNQNCSNATNKLNSTLLKRAQEVALDFWMVLFKNRVEIEPDLGNICARKTSARYQRGESGGQCYSLQKCIFCFARAFKKLFVVNFRSENVAPTCHWKKSARGKGRRLFLIRVSRWFTFSCSSEVRSDEAEYADVLRNRKRLHGACNQGKCYYVA